MIITKILYLILAVVAVVFYILFEGILSFHLLVFVICLPIVMIIITILARFFLKGEIEPASDAVLINEKAEITIKIKNKLPLPFPGSVITLRYSNNLVNKTENLKITVPIYPASTQKISVSLISEHCGILDISLASVKIFDYIKLFSFSLKPEKKCWVLILPNICDTESKNKLSHLTANESDIFSKSKTGDDPSEIFDLKEYAPGDKLSRIHWNLSLKYDDIIVKHNSLPINSKILLILDFCADKNSISLIDAATECAFSIAYHLLTLDMKFSFSYFDSSNQSPSLLPINDYRDVKNVMSDIFSQGICFKTDFPKHSKELFYDYSNIFFVTASYDNLSDIMSLGNPKQIRAFYMTDDKSRTEKLSDIENLKIFYVKKFDKSLANFEI